jgi:hypothetical protein
MTERPKNVLVRRALVALTALATLTCVVVAGAAARSSVAPQNTAAPQVSGTAKVGSSLTATNGTWSNSPTSYAYQWQRCANDGTSCGDITGATKQSYTLASGDLGHTVRVSVTASNADGKATASSSPTDVVGSANGPANTVRPTVSGTEQVGEVLTVSHGSWSPTVSRFTHQWQQCDADGSDCRDIAGATGQTYGVRAADVDHRLRALVTAHTSKGQTTAVSAPSGVVRSDSTTTTTSVTTTVEGNQPPTIKFMSLRRIGKRVFARFRVCDDSPGRLIVRERDLKTRQLPSGRKWAVRPPAACAAYGRSWIPAPRFRGRGRYVVTLRASDSQGALSRIVSRSLMRR